MSVPDFDGVYREHRRRLANLAAAITLDRTLAEEVVHDAFVGLHQRFDTIENPVGYLQRAVVHRQHYPRVFRARMPRDVGEGLL